MAKIPGTGVVSGIGLLGKCVYDNVKYENTCAIVRDKDPKQEVIQDVLNEVYSFMDLIAAGREMGLGMTHDIYCALVLKWCNEFGIRYNPYRNYHFSKHNGYGDSGINKSDESIKARIEAALIEYEKKQMNLIEEKRKEQKAYDALPWYKKHLSKGGSIALLFASVFVLFIVNAAQRGYGEINPVVGVFLYVIGVFGFIVSLRSVFFRF